MAQLHHQKAQRIIYLTAGFIKGDSNLDEQRELAAWTNENLENRLLFEELINNDKRTAAINKMQYFDTEGSLQNLKHRIGKLQEKKQTRIKTYWYAAAAILIAGIGSFFIQRQSPSTKLLTVSVPYGKIIQITLPDSSKAWLNAGTTLQYPEKFTGKTRRITLKNGQAYFEIIHDVSKPFLVNAKGMNVTVLGTSFEVTAFEKENKASVKVNSGKVGLQSPKQDLVFLLAGEKAMVNELSHKVYKTSFDVNDVAAWRNQQLIFEDETLPVVMQTLERTYNVHIEIRNKRLDNERITTRFKNQSIDNVLTALSFSNHFKYSKDNQLIIVN